MHDYLISMVNDHIDENIKNDTADFVIKTHNRQNLDAIPIPVFSTFISKSQTAVLERTEHSFASEKISLLENHHPLSKLRSASSNAFIKKEPLNRPRFESVIINSFSARAVNDKMTYPYPSGGGLYTGQVIIFVQNVDGYAPGAYHYLPVSNQFEKLDNLCLSLVNAALFMLAEKNFMEYDFFILYGSLMDKHICKYGYRGYRLAILEIGSMYRNLECEAQKAGLGYRVWGGFQDEALAVSLGIDPRVVVPVICQLIGRE